MIPSSALRSGRFWNTTRGLVRFSCSRSPRRPRTCSKKSTRSSRAPSLDPIPSSARSAAAAWGACISRRTAALAAPLRSRRVAPQLTREARHRDRLRREARAAAVLTHPGICTVYALEELDGELYIVTEFVEGHTLRDEIAGLARPSIRDDRLDRARACVGAVERARERHHPSRSQARKRHAHAGRPHQSARFRTRAHRDDARRHRSHC